MELYFLACFVIFLLLTLFTKLHDGAYSIGDMVFCGIVSVVPVVNVIALLYLFCITLTKHRVFSVVLF
jgi:hypothetical protein